MHTDSTLTSAADAEQRVWSYESWRAKLVATPRLRALYEREAAKKELWLRLVETRMDAGLTVAQMATILRVTRSKAAQIDRRGYDVSRVATLRRYVLALTQATQALNPRYLPRMSARR